MNESSTLITSTALSWKMRRVSIQATTYTIRGTNGTHDTVYHKWKKQIPSIIESVSIYMFEEFIESSVQGLKVLSNKGVARWNPRSNEILYGTDSTARRDDKKQEQQLSVRWRTRLMEPQPSPRKVSWSGQYTRRLDTISREVEVRGTCS